MRLTRSLMVGTLLIFAALLAACSAAGGGDGSASVELSGTAWELIALNGEPPLADTSITLEFSETDAMGVAGCNQYSGPYELEGEALTFGEMVRTMMACMEPEGVMEQEDAYLAALSSVASVRQSGGQLELLDAGGSVVLTFTGQ